MQERICGGDDVVTVDIIMCYLIICQVTAAAVVAAPIRKPCEA